MAVAAMRLRLEATDGTVQERPMGVLAATREHKVLLEVLRLELERHPPGAAIAKVSSGICARGGASGAVGFVSSGRAAAFASGNDAGSPGLDLWRGAGGKAIGAARLSSRTFGAGDFCACS